MCSTTYMARFLLNNDISTEALVGLERTIFTVSEYVGIVELCVRVFEPDIECPIQFPFVIDISTADGTTGIINAFSLMCTLLQ